MELKTSHYARMNIIDDEESSFVILFDGFHGGLDEVVSLIEIRGSFIDEIFLVLLELGLVHIVIG